ncbi:hypothetical protein J7K50_09235 [bacterium]|nr:hypothetical protein [bacterium]
MSEAKQGAQGKNFLWERYRALQQFRSTTLMEPDRLEDRRHEIHLRTLIDCGDFEKAISYVEDMAAFCDSVEDIMAAELYRDYKKRLVEIKGRNAGK